MTFLTPENVEALLKCCPTPDEVKLLQAYTDGKGKAENLACAERFLRELTNVPRVSQKLEVLKLAAGFKDELSETRDQIALLRRACEDLRGNEKLKRLLHVILSLGNALNDGTSHVAQGFRMDTLAKLSSLYAADKKTSLLSYVVSTVRTKTPEVSDWHTELDSLKQASETSFETAEGRLKELAQAVLTSKQELDRSREPFCQAFLRKMTIFVRSCDADLRPLQKAIEEATVVMGEVLEYYGETEFTVTAMEALFKSIYSFSKLYVVEQRTQERAPGNNTPAAKFKGSKSVAA